MSATEGNAPAHGHGDHHDDHAAHGSLKGYLTGFGLSILLTAIPFWVIMGDVFRSTTTAAVVVLVFGVVQIYVHMIYFLHMNSKAEQGWTMLSMIFTVVLVLITLGGSFWVMFHLNSNMMPMQAPHETMTSPK
ncbi:cytochrome o ubiquinol oxidase subunit IV [Hansschlegelia zhihuaiae]|uniref:Cytochrome bo(3) ubiquinol oxidase subunit 4 n=1 Tax=Hansschlegelia zhihuaiae TaxID=405005 RepID=A0A4Q0MGI3_9HYPH|nr:cytochrome o ubiquinol oxidase subunit IV [Hansschlegelia zhihuaiae]RXF72671.1 cytochrome o ubiquinol oxidase subunit IV [Hansschlegelia zhihuaiae]